MTVDTDQKQQQMSSQNYSKSNRWSNLKIVGVVVVALICMSLVGVTVAMAISSERKTDNNSKENKSIEVILIEIRQLMSSLDQPIQAYLIPPNDAHQSEYIGESDLRLQFVTNFTGSGGTAIIASTEAAIWVDSRYHIQAERQIDQEHWTVMKQGIVGVPDRNTWLLENLPKNSKVGFDPYLTSMNEYNSLKASLESAGHELIAVEENLVDKVWINKPEPNITPLEPHGLEYSGKPISEKLKDLARELNNQKVGALVLTSLDDIAWLFNLRATDISHTPVFYSYAVYSIENGLYLYLHDGRANEALEKHFKNENVEGVQILNYSEVTNELKKFVSRTNDKILVPTTASYAINTAIPEQRKKRVYSPVALMKPIKNAIESEGMRLCHLRDGAAIIRYLHWLEKNIDENDEIDEWTGASQLLKYRQEQDKFKDASFTSISSVGANAASPHYSPTPEIAKKITKNEVYMIDSGGQYLDGTTDTTRTVHFGTPTDFEREAYTRVLKGFISIHTAIFPSGASETFFDAMARRYLWDIGLDYGHGTGHGVGSFLGVHEYPPLLSSRVDNAHPGIKKGMFTSDEPGFYKEGEFGIRIEDVIEAVEATNIRFNFDGRGALMFRPITLVPFQENMINVSLLTTNEIVWIDSYHEKVKIEVGPLVQQQDNDAYEWLLKQTKPLSRL